MKLYMIRHGETNSNHQNIHCGWGLNGLTENGIRQAKRLGETLKGISFDQVFVSDLPRALQTMRTALPKSEATECELLREINVGTLSGKLIADCYAMYGEEYAKDKQNFNFSRYGGESYEQFCSRVGRFLKMMEQSACNKVAAFSHGGVIHAMLSILTGNQVDKSFYSCDNCGVFVFEYKKGRWQLNTWNYTGEM